MYDADVQWGRGEESISMYDMDGSLTGEAGSIVLRPGTYFTEGETCEERPEWNLQVCTGTFAKVKNGSRDN